MRKFLRTSPRMLMLASAAIVIVLIVCLLLSQKGSVFGDQSAADWAAALGRDPTTAKKRLRAGGAKAVPVLVELLESAGGLTASDAAEVLYEIAPQAPAALPPLLAARRHPSVGVRYWATRALERMESADDEMVSALIETLNDPSVTIRRRVARALGNLGPPARRALPELSRAFEDRNDIMRIAVAATLVRLDPGQTQALSFLIQKTGAESPAEFRRCALEALEWLGPAAADAAPKIRPLLDDPDEDIRQAAAGVLKEMARPAAHIKPAMFPVKRPPRP
jgi:HEAT repeat protein